MGGKRESKGPGIRQYVGRNGSTSYHVRVRQGKRARYGTAPTLKAAEQVRSKFLLELAEQEHDLPGRRKVERIRLKEFGELYRDRYLKVAAERSWRKSWNRVLNIVRLVGPDRYVDALGIRDVEDMLARVKVKGGARATRNRYRARLRSMLKQASRWGFRAGENPCDDVPSLREPRMGDRFLHPHELGALVDACTPRLARMVTLAASTGLRQGEILALRPSDVDAGARTVTVRCETSKTSRTRVVPLNGDAMGALEGLTSAPLFGLVKFPVEEWRVAVRSLGWDAEDAPPRLRGWRFHDLRHHAASWLVMNDVPILKVARILGHAELSTTMRYAHLADGSLIDAMERIPRGTSGARDNLVALPIRRETA